MYPYAKYPAPVDFCKIMRSLAGIGYSPHRISIILNVCTKTPYYWAEGREPKFNEGMRLLAIYEKLIGPLEQTDNT